MIKLTLCHSYFSLKWVTFALLVITLPLRNVVSDWMIRRVINAVYALNIKYLFFCLLSACKDPLTRIENHENHEYPRIDQFSLMTENQDARESWTGERFSDEA